MKNNIIIIANTLISGGIVYLIQITYCDFLSATIVTIVGLIISLLITRKLYKQLKSKKEVVKVILRIAYLLPTVLLITNYILKYSPMLISPDYYYATEHKSLFPFFHFLIEMM